MFRRNHFVQAVCGAALVAVSALLLFTPVVLADDDEEPTKPKSTIELLLDEIDRLKGELEGLRSRLAETELKQNEAERELEAMRRFIRDHHEYGRDFEQYTEIRAIAEREARQKQIEENRKRAEEAREARRERTLAARAQRDQEEAERADLARYEEAGFEDIGLGVWAGRMAFSYGSNARDDAWVDYDPLLGLYYRPGFPSNEIDYSRMTISGSVINAAEETRNLGVAITFFDEFGNQVGAEIVQVNNARSDVPYPFTAVLDMALNRAFSSSSTYVLYADPIAVEEPARSAH